MTDALDLATVTIHNSPDVRGWAITSEMTELGLFPDTLHLHHSMAGVWRPVPFETTTQEATFWIFLRINGAWHGTGAERIRPNQHDKPAAGPSGMVASWLYDANRWGPMTNYQPQPGEVVGVMLTAGDARGAGVVYAHERTPVYLLKWPTNTGASYPPWVTLAEDSAAPAPPTPPANPVLTGDMERLLDACDRIVDGLGSVVDATARLVERLDYLKEHGVRLTWR